MADTTSLAGKLSSILLVVLISCHNVGGRRCDWGIWFNSSHGIGYIAHCLFQIVDDATCVGPLFVPNCWEPNDITR